MKKPKKIGLRQAVERILAEEGDLPFDALAERLREIAARSPFCESELAELPDILREAFAGRPTLRLASDGDLTELTETLSTVHPILLSADSIYPSEDAVTRAIKRRRVERYARFHRLEPAKAAEIYRERPPKLHPISRSILPLIAALCTALIPAWLSDGPILLSILLILPLFEGFRYALEQILLHFGKEYHFPALIPSPDQIPPLLILWSGELADAPALCGYMEQSYLSDHTGDVLFGLILDGEDAPSPELLSDYAGLSAAKAEIDRLIDRYGDHFVLLWRKRAYCPHRNLFVGGDREMGVAESAARLCQSCQESADRPNRPDGSGEAKPSEDTEIIIGDRGRLAGRKYLLILQKNGQIPYGELSRLAGILLHPVNAPVFEGGRVTKGYGGFRIGGEILRGPGETVFSALGVQNPDSALCLSVELLNRVCEGGPLRCRESERLSVAFTRQLRVYVQAPDSPIDYFRQIAGAARESFCDLKSGFSHRSAAARGRMLHRIGRSLLYPAAFAAILLALLYPGRQELRILLSAVSAFLLPVLPVLIGSGRTFFRRFFTQVLPRFWQAIAATLFRIAALPFSALCAATGAIRGLRARRRRQRYSRSDVWRRLTPAQILSGLLPLAFSDSALMRILGILWILLPAFLAYISRRKESPAAGRADLIRLRGYAKAAWQYFETFADSDKTLPPAWVCVSPYPGQADFGSPSALGLTMAADFAAFDLGLIDRHTLTCRIEGLVGLLEILPKKHGLPYARFLTDGSDVVGDPILSAYECGILAVCLICAISGLESLKGGSKSAQRRRDQLISRLKKLKSAMDFRALSHEKLPCLLKSRSYPDDPANGPICASYASADMLCVLAGVASGQLSPDFLTYPKAGLTERGGYTGITSAHGGLDDYLLPFAFLPVIKGTLSYEGALFALSTQIRTARRKGRPIFGSGDGGCFAFSKDGDHRPALTHGGDPELAEGAADPDAIHPYTSFLALPFLPRRAVANLRTMERMGGCGEYGFYDAIDYNRGRVGASFAIPEVYRTAHQALILISVANLLCDRPFEKRLLADPTVAACLPLLQRKVPDFSEIRKADKADAQGESDVLEGSLPLRTLTVCAVGNGDLSAVLSDVGHFQLRRRGEAINRLCFDPRAPGERGESLRLVACLGDRPLSLLSGRLSYTDSAALFLMETPGAVCRTLISVGRIGKRAEHSVLTLKIQCDGGAGALSAGLFLCFYDSGSAESLPGMNLVILRTSKGYLGIGYPTGDATVDVGTNSRVLPVGYTDADLCAALFSLPSHPHPKEDLLLGMVRIRTSGREATFQIAAGDSREEILSAFRALAGESESAEGNADRPSGPDGDLSKIPAGAGRLPDALTAPPDPIAEWMLAGCLLTPSDGDGRLTLIPDPDLPPEKLLPFAGAAERLCQRGFPTCLTVRTDPEHRDDLAALFAPYESVRVPSARLDSDGADGDPFLRTLSASDSIREITLERPAVCLGGESNKAPVGANSLCPYGNGRMITLLGDRGMGCSYLGEGTENPLTLPPFGALSACTGERLLWQGKGQKAIDLLAAADECEFTPECALYRLHAPFEGEIRIGCDPDLPLKLILCRGSAEKSLELSVLPFGRQERDREIRLSRDGDAVFFRRPSDQTTLFVCKFALKDQSSPENPGKSGEYADFSASKPSTEGGTDTGILLGAIVGEDLREYFAIREKYRTRADFLDAFAKYGRKADAFDAFYLQEGLPDRDFARRAYLWNRLRSPGDLAAFRFLLIYDPDGYRDRLLTALSRLPAAGEYSAADCGLCEAAGRYLRATGNRDFLEIPLPYADSPFRESVYLHLIRILDGAPDGPDRDRARASLAPYLHENPENSVIPGDFREKPAERIAAGVGAVEFAAETVAPVLERAADLAAQAVGASDKRGGRSPSGGKERTAGRVRTGKSGRSGRTDGKSLPRVGYPALPESVDGYGDYLCELTESALGLQIGEESFILSPCPPGRPMDFFLRVGEGAYRVSVLPGEKDQVKLDGEIVNIFNFPKNGAHFLEITVEKFKKKM